MRDLSRIKRQISTGLTKKFTREVLCRYAPVFLIDGPVEIFLFRNLAKGRARFARPSKRRSRLEGLSKRSADQRTARDGCGAATRPHKSREPRTLSAKTGWSRTRAESPGARLVCRWGSGFSAARPGWREVGPLHRPYRDWRISVLTRCWPGTGNGPWVDPLKKANYLVISMWCPGAESNCPRCYWFRTIFRMVIF